MVLTLGATLFFSFRDAGPLVTISSFGKQPALAVDKANHVHVVFGRANEIFYTYARDGALSFAVPRRVGEQKKLALGASRGPQIISTDDYLLIAAADHAGRILAYRSPHGGDGWEEPVSILKGDSTAKEGFIALAAGKANNVHATWLDLRIGNHNNIFSASSADGGKTWSDSRLVYQAPEGKVCPCCRPSISADREGNVYIMFRNELKGARDLYLAHSKDGGKTFSPATKLGTGTWLLESCPMDGGAVSMDEDGRVGTTWRRENSVFYSEPGKPERRIGEGRASTMLKTAKGNYFAWQQGSQIVLLTPDKLDSEIIGGGAFPRLAATSEGPVICVWESEGQIVAKKIP